MKILVGIVVFVLIGGVAFGVYKSGVLDKPGNETQDQGLGQTTNKPTGVLNPSGSYTVNELFTMNRPLKCTWKQSLEGDSDVTNIIYIKGQKFYQDVTMGDVGHSYVVNDSEYLYMWNDFSDSASKMRYEDIKVSPAAGLEKPEDTSGMDQKRDFVCESWTADESVFVPPQNKNFKDITEEMTQAVQEINSGGLDEMKQKVCEMCKQAPTQEQIDECLTGAQCE